MKWWSSVVNWLSSNEGTRVVTDAILPFLAIVVAGVIAALIARSMAVRVLALHESESKSAAVASLIAVARKATIWQTLGAEEKSHSEHLGDEASVRLRLLPVPGAGLAAAWAEHEIETIKSNASTFSFQAEQSFNDLRDRLVEWQAKPVRARKLFRPDLERWRVEDESAARRAAAVEPTSAEPAALPRATAIPQEAPAVAPATWAAPAVEPAQRGAASQAPEVAPAESAIEIPEPASPTSSSTLPTSATAGAESAPARTPTGMVSTPVVQPPHATAPASPSDAADRESGDDSDREPAFSAPVSAHQVRRRTSPEHDES